MREIKFKYYYGIKDQPKSYFFEIFTLDQIEWGEHFELLENEPLLKGYIIFDKCEYTGLKDKIRTEIYENDIVEYYEYDEIYFGEIIFNNGLWKIKDKSLDIAIDDLFYVDFKQIEVVGNIHQNYKLLKER